MPSDEFNPIIEATLSTPIKRGFSLFTPKHRKNLTRDERLMVNTLSSADHSQQWISHHLNYTRRQVLYVLLGSVVSQKRPDRPSQLSLEQVQQRILFVRSSRRTRQMSYLELSLAFLD
jgi:hypothetical protein